MPRSTREWALRKLKEAIDNIVWCGYHLDEVAQKYEEQHPEIATPLWELTVVLEEIIRSITKIRGSF